jgi:TRAP-type uncharacterized transport system substrate-binding protein
MPHRKIARWLHTKVAYSVGFGVVFLLAVGAGLFYYQMRVTGRPVVLRIGYGAVGPVRKHFLEQLVLKGKERNLDIRLVETSSTNQTMSLIESGATDLGLINSAIEDQGGRRILEIAPLYMEPLHLLVREDLYDLVAKDFGQLKGKRISLDSQESTTYLLATELLRFIGLADPVTAAPYYTPVSLSQASLTSIKDRSELPDAIFQIVGVPSPGVRSVVAAHNYRLVPLPFGESFNLDKFRESETPDYYKQANLRLNKAFVEESIIPQFTYSVLPAVPPADTRTLAMRLMLVGSGSLDDRVVHRLLDLVFSPEISSLAIPSLTVDLLNSSFEFERHHGTNEYVRSLKPTDYEAALSNYVGMIEVWGSIIALYVAAAQGLKMLRHRQDRERKAVGDFLAEVLAVEAQATVACSADERARLDQRLTDIKRESIELHLADRLEGADELPSLLVTLADARTRIWGPAS